MDKNERGSSPVGIIAVVICAVLMWKIVPGLFKIASMLAGVVAVLFVIIIVIGVVYAIKAPVKKQRGGVEQGDEDGEACAGPRSGTKSGTSDGKMRTAQEKAAEDADAEHSDASKDAPTLDMPQELKNAKKCLLDIMSENVKIRDPEIRSISSDVSSSAGKIIDALADQPEDIRKCRQFYNYYLPTYLQILRKYRKLEASGVDMGDMKVQSVSYMSRIRTALDRQYEALFENDKFDLSVEMEALDRSLKASGLLTDDEQAVAQAVAQPVAKPVDGQTEDRIEQVDAQAVTQDEIAD